jgi:hypothetical protein
MALVGKFERMNTLPTLPYRAAALVRYLLRDMKSRFVNAAIFNGWQHLSLVASTSTSTPWYNADDMAEKFDIDKFSRIVLDEFGRVHERLDQIGQRFDNRLLGLGSEIRSIHRELDALSHAVGNMTGFSKEIDHLLHRVAAIEKHLGLTSSIKA